MIFCLEFGILGTLARRLHELAFFMVGMSAFEGQLEEMVHEYGRIAGAWVRVNVTMLQFCIRIIV